MMSEPSLIPGTRELYSFVVSNTIIINSMSFFIQLQKDGPALLKTLLPALPEVVELMGKSDPDISQQQLEELMQKAKTYVAFQWPPEIGPAAERFCFETMTTRLTDSFEYYLSQILTRTLRTYPGALSDSQISMRELLECASIDEALNRQIERKVHDLTFSGLEGVADFLKKQFKAEIDRNSASYRIVSEAIEIRHLIVHNKGNVDRRFILHTGRKNLKLGQMYPLDWQWASSTLHAFSDLTKMIDSTIIRCLKLTQISAATKE